MRRSLLRAVLGVAALVAVVKWLSREETLYQYQSPSRYIPWMRRAPQPLDSPSSPDLAAWAANRSAWRRAVLRGTDPAVAREQWHPSSVVDEIGELKLAPPTLNGTVVYCLFGDAAMRSRMAHMLLDAWHGTWHWFIAPQHLDVVFVVPEMSHIEFIAQHINISLSPQAWHWIPENGLDGTRGTARRTTLPYRGARVSFVLADMPVPQEVVDRGWVQERSEGQFTFVPDPMKPCVPSGIGYIQGTRSYTWHIWQLDIVRQYGYVVKVDYDISFHNFIPFNLVDDMAAKGAVMGHTGLFARGECSCTGSIGAMMDAFVRSIDQVPLSQDVIFMRNCDAFYTNFIVLRTDFWASPNAMLFARFMNDWHEGFWRARWTDQTYFHKALGLWLADPIFDNQAIVRDYSQLRCSHQADGKCFESPTLEDIKQLCSTHRTAFVHYKGPFPMQSELETVVPRNTEYTLPPERRPSREYAAADQFLQHSASC